MNMKEGLKFWRREPRKTKIEAFDIQSKRYGLVTKPRLEGELREMANRHNLDVASVLQRATYIGRLILTLDDDGVDIIMREKGKEDARLVGIWDDRIEGLQ